MYDVIIIGAGSAGLSARNVIAKHTNNYLVIDNGPLGTMCARTGCMPTKSFIKASKKSESIEDALKHTRSLRDRFVDGVKKGMKNWETQFLRGYACFKDSHTVIVNDKSYQAKSFIIAVGSRPFIPEKWERFREYFLTTEDFFEQRELPEHMAVIGLGPVGLELAQAMSRLSINVKGFNRKELLERVEDKQLQQIAKDEFSKDFDIHIGEVELEIHDNQLLISGNGVEYHCPKALLSIGRVSNIDKLKLDIELNKLNENYSLEQYPHIYVVGDANNNNALLHEANYEGRVAAHSILSMQNKIKPMVDMGIIFTDPQVAYVGKPENGSVCGFNDFKSQGRSLINQTNYGGIKVYFDDKTQVIQGARVISADAEYIVHFLAAAIEKEMTREELLDLPYYHPTVFEGVKTAIAKAK